MKKIVFVVLFAALFCGILSGCKTESSQPFNAAFCQASEIYIDFIETAMQDWQKAVNEYCYFASEEDKSLALTGTPIPYCEILRMEKISGSLWVIESFSKTEMIPDGIYGVHYVGQLEGKWYVFLNLKFIPSELTDGVEIEPYTPHGPGIL